MRILVTGSRDWTDVGALARALVDAVIGSPTYGPGAERITLVHGACPTGADAIADHLARNAGWTVETHPANWAAHGKAAGPSRNREMVALGADAVLAFPLGKSHGTRGCIAEAQRAGLPVHVVEGRPS